MRPPHSSHTLRATLLVVLSACCFGSISPLTVFALKSGAALQAIQAVRYLTAALLLIGLAAWKQMRNREPIPSTPARAIPWYSPRVLLIAGGGQASVATLALLALRWIPAATAAFMFYTYPAWVALMSAARGIEPLDRVRVLALLLSLGGIAAMVGAPSAASMSPVGIAVILAAALVYALYIPVLNGLQRHRPPLDVARAISVGGAIIFLIWALATGTLFAHFDAPSLAASALQGVLSTGAFLGFLAGLAQLGAVRTAITSTVEPFWTTMVGVVWLGQPLSVGTLIGGAAIMGAVLLLQRPVVSSGGLHSSESHTDDRSGRLPPEDS
jgi:drug/metabolite transporter (DMT)-like permease